MLEHRARAVTHTSNREPHPDGARHTLFGTPRFCVKVKHRFRGASRHRYRTRSPSAEIPQHVRLRLLTAPKSGSDRGANPLRGRVPQATPATHPTSVNSSPFHTWRVDNRFHGDLRAARRRRDYVNVVTNPAESPHPLQAKQQRPPPPRPLGDKRARALPGHPRRHVEEVHASVASALLILSKTGGIAVSTLHKPPFLAERKSSTTGC